MLRYPEPTEHWSGVCSQTAQEKMFIYIFQLFCRFAMTSSLYHFCLCVCNGVCIWVNVVYANLCVPKWFSTYTLRAREGCQVFCSIVLHLRPLREGLSFNRELDSQLSSHRDPDSCLPPLPHHAMLITDVYGTEIPTHALLHWQVLLSTMSALSCSKISTSKTSYYVK